MTPKLEQLWELESKDQRFREDHDQEEEDDSNEKEITAQENSVATTIKTTHLEVGMELHNMPQQLQEDVTEKIDTAISGQEHALTVKSSTFLSAI